MRIVAFFYCFIIKKNDLIRHSGRFNATQKFLEDRLTLEVNLNVANTENERPPVSTILGDAISNNPTYPLTTPVEILRRIRI